MPNLKPAYPVHLSDKDTEMLHTSLDYNSNPPVFNNHFFDFKDQHKSCRIHKDDISQACKPQRGVDGVCKYYRLDESKIIPNFVK